MLDSAIDCVILMDGVGRIVEFNPAAERTFGHAREHVIGRDLAETIIPARLRERHREGLRRHLADGRTAVLDRRIEMPAVRADGSEFPVELAVTATVIDGETCFTGYLRDITERERAEGQLRLRVAQQAAVAELGQLALADQDLQGLLDRAVRLVADALDNALCQVLELQPGGERFLIRAGVGWPEGVIGHATVGMEFKAGYTVRRGEPVIMEDRRAETRFEVSPLLVDQGVISGITVPIPGHGDTPWGVLGTHSTARHRFTSEDAHFLESVANTLAMAIERRRWNESLQASEARERARADELNAVMASVPALVWIAHDSAATQITGSRASYEFLGLPQGCNESQTSEAGHPPAHFEVYQEGLKLGPQEFPVRRAARGEAVNGCELDTRFADGSRRSLFGSATPMYDDEGRPRGAVAAFVDITQRKRKEQTAELLAEVTDVLASSLDYERTLEKVADLAVPRLADWCAVDIREPEDGRIRRFVAHADPARVALAHEVLERYPLDLDAPRGAPAVLRTGEPEWARDISDDMLREAARDEEHLRVLRELGLRSYICMPIKGRGQVLGAITLVMAESGLRAIEDELRLAEELTYRVALAVDNARLYQEARRELAERERAERDLRELNEQLEERVAERTAELASRAEQLRVLAAELGEVERRERQRLSQILHDDLQQLLVAAKMRLSGIRTAANTDGRTALEEARDLLGQSIEEARSLSGELAPPVLHDLGLGPALEWLSRWARESYGLQVAVEADGSQEAENDQLRTLLFQLLRELLLNVVKHAGVERARVALQRDDRALHLAVIDEGAGFAPEAIGGQEHGRGTGLSTIMSRLDLLGATIDIDSQPGAGTRVQITVPRERVPARRPEAPQRRAGDGAGRPEASRDRAAPRPGEAVRILLVDDHEVLRHGLAQLLEQEPDMEVVGQGASGEEALELADRLRPDTVVMDISLPGISGLEATRRLTGTWPDLRVVGLSIHDEDSVATAMRHAGAADYLTKGGASQDLIQAIRRPPAPG